ncbi:MAG: hypothetical protein KY475_10135 [Planctomycetes bacterium]|nr:hypothetical protein [Planctomycetota bacterium]
MPVIKSGRLETEPVKASGFVERVEVQSGYTAGGLGGYIGLRGESVTFFVRQLARGRQSLTYRLHPRPLQRPDLKGNSEEIKLRIED